MTAEGETPKYAVLHWEDWVKVKEILTQVGRPPLGLLVADGEVIRKQDITSAPIFHAYASIIMSYVDVLLLGGGEGDPEVMKKIEALTEVADHFSHAAADAENWPVKKLPT